MRRVQALTATLSFYFAVGVAAMALQWALQVSIPQTFFFITFEHSVE